MGLGRGVGGRGGGVEAVSFGVVEKSQRASVRSIVNISNSREFRLYIFLCLYKGFPGGIGKISGASLNGNRRVTRRKQRDLKYMIVDVEKAVQLDIAYIPIKFFFHVLRPIGKTFSIGLSSNYLEG